MLLTFWGTILILFNVEELNSHIFFVFSMAQLESLCRDSFFFSLNSFRKPVKPGLPSVGKVRLQYMNMDIVKIKNEVHVALMHR